MMRLPVPAVPSRRPDFSRGVRVRGALVLGALVLAAAGIFATGLPDPVAPSAHADELTASVNLLRDGWDSTENTGSLQRATLAGGTFGELFATHVNGQVYAQPVVADNTSAGDLVIVATENDWVYALSADTGQVVWQTSLGTPWPSSAENCADLNPYVGVTGTPVYDPGTGTVYLVSMVIPPGGGTSHPAFFMNALNVTTGAEQPHWPVPIKGSPANDPTVTFNPFTELQRPGLLLLGGAVYAAFGSRCDFTPYDGYVVGVNAAKVKAADPLAQVETMWTDEAGVTSSQAGIWQSGGGLMSDGPGRIIFASGNGVSPGPGPGSKPPSQLAESVVRLAVQSDGSLVARDFFSPYNAPYLDSVDMDFGSGAPAGLPFGTSALPHLLVQAGKADGIYLLNRDTLGGRQQGQNKADAAVSRVASGMTGQWGHPAAFADTPVLAPGAIGHDFVYYVGSEDKLRYFRAVLGSSGTPLLADVAQSSDTFPFSSGSPVVTSDGSKPATAVVWVVRAASDSGTTGTLEAFPAVPPGTCSLAAPCTMNPIWTSAPFGRAGKFTIPATDEGRVYIGTRGVTSNGGNCPLPSGTICGEIIAFGSPTSAPLSASPADLGDVAVGSASSPQAVTVTDTMSSGTMTVKSVSASGGAFAVAGPFEYTPQGGAPTPVTLPYLLNPGDQLTAEGVTCTPTTPGMATGAVNFSTDVRNFPVVGVGVTGTGIQNGMYASSTSVAFSGVPVGTTTQQQVTIMNAESVPVTLTWTGPSSGSPFSVAGLPAQGASIAAGQSIPLTITYRPAGTAGDSDSLTLNAADSVPTQTQTVISLTGAAVPDIEPTLTAPATVNFGTVHLGTQALRIIDVKNTGNVPALISGSTTPPIPFGFPDSIASGLPLNPGNDVRIPVTFAPASIGPASGTYNLTWTDVNGSHPLSVALTGTAAAPSSGIAVPPPGGGWILNGSARMLGSRLSLTQLVKNQAGSAVYSVPVPSSGLKATFTTTIGGGTGADGLTFALLDAAQANQSALGGTGSLLGFGGQRGVAVTVDTYKEGPGYPSGNFVGIATGLTATGALKFAGTATNVPPLRNGSHVIGVSVSNGTISVTVDGTRYLSRSVALPGSVLLAFTGATGAYSDNHVVSHVSITAGGHPIQVPGGGWSYNGAAAMAGSDSRLTPALPSLAGSVVYPYPVQAAGLTVTFNAQLGGGTGGDGLTFGLLDPASTGPTTVGLPGVWLGLASEWAVPGIGVVLGTDGPVSTAGSPADFVATARRAGANGLHFQTVAHGIGSLTTGTHTVTIAVTKDATLGFVVTLWLDGAKVIQEAEPTLTPTVRLAFTAGTGTATDVHVVRGVSIAAVG